MSDTVFVVKELENGWEWNDVYCLDDIHIYCEEELEIPADSINKISFLEQAFEICLKRNRQSFREDWYVNLCRISA